MTAPTVSTASTIDEVVDELDDLVAWARVQASPLGYFATLYRGVTARVRDALAHGFFDDGPRMEHLDVIFANRYLAALQDLRHGRQPSRSWQVALGAAERHDSTVVQHLLVGISAHINLDLGIAAAQVAPGDALPDLRRDFERINEILASTLERTQQALATISPWLGLLDVAGGRSDEQVLRFSIETARTEAWHFAVELAALSGDERSGPVAVRDRRVAGLGRAVLRPGLLTPVLWLVRLAESDDVRHNVDVLAQVEGPALDDVEQRVTERRGS